LSNIRADLSSRDRFYTISKLQKMAENVFREKLSNLVAVLIKYIGH